MAKADVSEYANKAPTDYHKWFAKWIVTEVGYDPENAPSKRAAFLRGVSIATASRPAFMNSDYLEEMREKYGVTKRGPKPRVTEEEEDTRPVRRTSKTTVSTRNPSGTAKTRRKPEPEPEFDEDEFDEDELDENVDESDDEFDEDDNDDDDEFDDDDEEEEPPAPVRRGRPAKKAAAAKRSTPAKRAPAKKAAPAKTTNRKAAKPSDDDDDFVF